MRIAVVGAGAIGGFIAAALARAGVDVAVVARGEHLAAIRRNGLILVQSDLGAFSVPVEASDDLRAIGPVDLAILTFKSHQWPALLEQFDGRPHLHVVTMQNGVPFWFRRHPPLASVDSAGRIGARFDDAHTIGGVVHVSGHIVAPGRVHQSGGMRYVLGAVEPGAEPALRELTEAMTRAGLSPEIAPDIREIVWLKLVNNAGLNPVSALHDATISQLLAVPELRAQVRGLMDEALQTGRALGVVQDADLDARLDYASRLSDVRTSMLQDRLAGRPLELEPILGAVIELAAEAGVPVPLTRDAYERLRA
jgi:2-dehydropantoate 2-reductase